jgi:hypothetical protein
MFLSRKVLQIRWEKMGICSLPILHKEIQGDAGACTQTGRIWSRLKLYLYSSIPCPSATPSSPAEIRYVTEYTENRFCTGFPFSGSLQEHYVVV